MQYKFVEVYFSSMRVSYFFRFWKAIVWSWKSLKRFVAMFTFFDILIEVKYLQASLPFPTLSLNFWRFWGTGRFGRVSRYFLLFFWWIVLFSSTRSLWPTNVFLFSNSTISTKCITKSSKHSSGTFGLCKSDFNSFKSSLHETLIVFFGKYFIGISLKPADILLTTCMSTISFFSSAVVVLLPFGESPLKRKGRNFYTLEQAIPRLYLYNIA